MPKLIRITTVPISLEKLLGGQLSFMKDYYQVVGVSSDAHYLEKVGKKEGVKTHCVEMTRQITPLKDLKALWKMYRFFKKEKPFIVHSHTPKAGTVSMMAAWMAGVPNRLHTVAGLPLVEAVGTKRKVLNWVETITYKCATHVYPNSLGLKEIILQEKFCPADKLKVIAQGSSNGIDSTLFSPEHFSESDNQTLREKLGIAPDDFVFVFVGRLVADKGINELIEAFDSISKKYPKVKLLLVGGMESELDPLKEETEAGIKNNKSIIPVGFQPDVRAYFAISDALVFPSYREGFPNVVMQAGAMGLPSIVSNINGCNEIIESNVNGTIIPVKDALALEAVMQQYLNNPELINRMKVNTRQMIKDRYEQKVIWNALLKEYKTLEK